MDDFTDTPLGRFGNQSANSFTSHLLFRLLLPSTPIPSHLDVTPDDKSVEPWKLLHNSQPAPSCPIPDAFHSLVLPHSSVRPQTSAVYVGFTSPVVRVCKKIEQLPLPRPTLLSSALSALSHWTHLIWIHVRSTSFSAFESLAKVPSLLVEAPSLIFKAIIWIRSSRTCAFIINTVLGAIVISWLFRLIKASALPRHLLNLRGRAGDLATHILVCTHLSRIFLFVLTMTLF